MEKVLKDIQANDFTQHSGKLNMPDMVSLHEDIQLCYTPEVWWKTLEVYKDLSDYGQAEFLKWQEGHCIQVQKTSGNILADNIQATWLLSKQ